MFDCICWVTIVGMVYQAVLVPNTISAMAWDPITNQCCIYALVDKGGGTTGARGALAPLKFAEGGA